MKKYTIQAAFAACSILTLVVFAIWGCHQKSSNQQERVTIGAILPLTGPSAFIGESEKNTLVWLTEDANKNGGIAGKQINLVVYDSVGDPSQALSYAKRLVDQDHASIVIGPGTSGESLAVKDYFTQAQVPLLSLAASYKIVNPISPWVFKLAQSDSHAIEQIYGLLVKSKKHKIALLTAADGFGSSGRQELQRLAPPSKLDIVYDETFAPADTDMTAQLERIKTSNAEVVIVWGTNPGPAIITRNLRQLNMTQMLIQSHGIASKKYIELAGNASNGVILPAGKLLVCDALPASDSQRAILIQYRDGYQSKFNSPVNTFGGHAWDAFQLIKKSMAKGHTLPQQIRDDIESSKGYVGVTGVYNFSPQDHNGLTKDAFEMTRIDGGDWKRLP